MKTLLVILFSAPLSLFAAGNSGSVGHPVDPSHEELATSMDDHSGSPLNRQEIQFYQQRQTHSPAPRKSQNTQEYRSQYDGAGAENFVEAPRGSRQ